MPRSATDVELEDSATLRTLAAQLLPWYAPSVAVLGAGHERDVAAALAQGNGGLLGHHVELARHG